MVWAIHVEIAGQRQGDSFILTVGHPEQPREFTVGRPPAKADTRPDIVVPEKSVSKIHAVLRLQVDIGEDHAPSQLIIADRSRYGTTVNGQKLPLGGSLELRAGDVVQLAPKTFLIVEDLPLVLAVHPDHPQLGEVREAARRAGAQLTHVYDGSTMSHVLYDPGDVAWSALAQGALCGATFVGLDWLHNVASAGMLTGSLPAPPQPGELRLLPGGPGVPLPLPAAARSACRDLLGGVTFGYSSEWRDAGLAALLTGLGGWVADSPQQLAAAVRGRAGSGAAAGVVVLADGQGGDCGGDGNGGGPGRLSVRQLLTSILTLEAAAVRRLVATAAVPVTPGSGSAAATGAAPRPEEGSEGAMDSDMTQAAEEEDDGEGPIGGAEVHGGAGAGSGSAAEERSLGPGPRGGFGASRSQGQAGPSSRPHPPASAPPSGLLSGPRNGSARGAEAEAAAAAVRDADGWMVVMRRPEDAHPPSTAADAANVFVPHEDAPPAKKRRLTETASAAATAAGSQPNGGGTTVVPSPTAQQQRQLLHHPPPGRPPGPPRASAAPTPSTHVSLPPTKHEPVEEAPWMTQQLHGRGGGAGGTGAGASRRGSAAGLRPPPAAVAIKEESVAPQAPGPSARGGKGKAGKGDGVVDELGGQLGRVGMKEEPAGPEVLDSSAQVVLEADLFAPTPEQPPPRYRSGSAEPHDGSAGGGGGFSGSTGGSYGSEHNCTAAAIQEQQLQDYKQFRKQGAQLPRTAVQPLPVFLVDNFQRTDETEAFLRREEERATHKRRADEMFKRAEVGARKPPRPPQRRG